MTGRLGFAYSKGIPFLLTRKPKAKTVSKDKLVRLDLEFTLGETTPPTATLTGRRMDTKAGPIVFLAPAHIQVPVVEVRPANQGWSVILKGFNRYTNTMDAMVLHIAPDQDHAEEYAKRFMGLAQVLTLDTPA